jgi:phytoene dehydrogenase-like protein
MRQACGYADAFDGLVEAGKLAILRAFRQAGVGDLGPHIVAESVRTPAEWQDLYGLQHGAAFGLDHGLDQLSIFRPPNKDPRVSGHVIKKPPAACLVMHPTWGHRGNWITCAPHY